MKTLKSVNWKYVSNHVFEFVFSFTLWVTVYTFVAYKIITSKQFDPLLTKIQSNPILIVGIVAGLFLGSWMVDFVKQARPQKRDVENLTPSPA